VRAVVVIVIDVVFDYSMKLTVGKDDKVIQAIIAHRAHKPFRVSVHVWGVRHNGYVLKVILVIGEPF